MSTFDEVWKSLWPAILLLVVVVLWKLRERAEWNKIGHDKAQISKK